MPTSCKVTFVYCTPGLVTYKRLFGVISFFYVTSLLANRCGCQNGRFDRSYTSSPSCLSWHLLIKYKLQQDLIEGGCSFVKFQKAQDILMSIYHMLVWNIFQLVHLINDFNKFQFHFIANPANLLETVALLLSIRALSIAKKTIHRR